jgi:hypothetical protein
MEGKAIRESDDLETHYLSQQLTAVPSYKLLLLPMYGFQFYNIINPKIFTQQTADTVYSVVGNVWKSWNPPPLT